RRHTLTAKAHALCALWLRAGEAMLRRLLLIEAAAYAKTNAPPARGEHRARPRTLYAFSPGEPGNWRAWGRALLSSSPARGGSPERSEGKGEVATSPFDVRFANATSPVNGGRKEPRRFRSAWPLAERYEALLRAYNEPALYAQRLARRLHVEP